MKLNVITSIHTPNQEMLEYPWKHVSILHAQKFCRAHPVNNTANDCLALVEFDLVDTYLYSR